MKKILPRRLLKSFTLIEILIVIALIAVLAGLLVTVLDPQAQREKGYDAVIQSTMSKLVVNLQAYESAYGEYPSCEQLMTDAKNVARVLDCNSTKPLIGAFSVSGVLLSSDQCDLTSGLTTGGGPCYFYYARHATFKNKACLAVRAYRNINGGNYVIWADGVSSTLNYPVLTRVGVAGVGPCVGFSGI